MTDEARKFFRYVMPGILYMLLTIAFLALVDLPLAKTIIENFFDGKGGLGIVVATFFSSGGVGYLFASLHHFVFWRCSGFENVFDHRELALELDRIGRISLSEIEREVIQSDDIYQARRVSQAAAMTLWYKEHTNQHPGKDGIDHLGNQAHALGTAAVSVFFAAITALIVAIKNIWQNPDCALIGFAVLILSIGLFLTLNFSDQFRRVAYFSHEPFRKLMLENPTQPLIPKE